MKKVFFWFFLLLQGGQVFAQTESRTLTTLSIVPQYLLNHGIRIDVERQIGEKSFLQIGPQFYMAKKPYLKDISSLSGIGCGVFHKIYLLEDYMNQGFYLSYGLTYNYFGLDVQDYPYNAEGLARGRINKIGADLIFGYQIFEYERIIFDLYAGLGIRYSMMNPGQVEDYLDDFFWSLNYTGNILVLGVRFGCVL